ncbi:MAG TPA: hypothetical protein VJ991_04475 [Balneolales bacterium]|nr:hypothetical protein [Balneolales bacterium]
MKVKLLILLIILPALFFMGCSDIFSSKKQNITNQIFKDGKKDPKSAEDVVGYAALLPFWSGFNQPTDVCVGFDELVYVTDKDGLHVLDRAGREYKMIPFKGAISVVQDRLLNVYVAARYDTVIKDVDPGTSWDLAAIYKLRNANGAGNLVFVDTLIHPFADASRSTYNSQVSRLVKNSPDDDELVEFTGLSVLTDNTLYVTRRGPKNEAGSVVAPDNIVLEFQPVGSSSNEMARMQNVRQIRTLSSTVPSLISGIGMSDIITFIGPPQRETMTDNRSFLVAQADQNTEIPFRVLWINAVETTDGLVFQPNTSLLSQDTSKANGFLYETNKFKEPTGLAYAADGTNYIFVVDAGTDSLYVFQSNGYEGVTPPVGSDATKPVIVSFGGRGSGPKNLDDPSGVAYFSKVVYVADKNNNRIARYKLTTDFE